MDISAPGNTQSSLPRKNFFGSPILIFAVFILTIAIGFSVLYFGFIQPKQKQAEEIALKSSEQKKQEALEKVDLIISKIQNPNPELIEKYQPMDEPMKQSQDLILYGADPKSFILGGTPDIKFLPESLFGIKASIKAGEYEKASQEILKVFRQIAQPFTAQNPPNFDSFVLTKEDLDKIDPQFKFHRESDLRMSLSAIKQEAAVDVIGLYYYLQ